MAKRSNVFKDVFYNKDNEHLEIARFSSFLAVSAFLFIGVYLTVVTGQPPTLSEFGIGWGGVAGGSAAWIYARQRLENGIDVRQDSNMGYGNPYQNMGGYGYSSPYYGGYSGDPYMGGPGRPYESGNWTDPRTGGSPREDTGKSTGEQE